MKTTLWALLVFLLALASTTRAQPHARKLDVSNIPDADVYGAGFTANWWWARFTNVGDKTSCPTEPLTNEQKAARIRRVPMIFERPLKTVPMVLVSVTKLHAANSKALSYEAQASGVTKEGFILEFKVYCDTFVDEVEVQWMALG
eukprot:g92.t1